GTSNIVALDVMRAIRRNNCLEALKEHVETLLADAAPCVEGLAALQRQSIDKAYQFAAMAALEENSALARQAATALYNVMSIATLRWEARLPGLESRAQLADLVLIHRLAPYDPCAQFPDHGQYAHLLAEAP
ncbi:MAG TPA: DNA alkylation response protein, partial [Burkholderiaceae bacterium]|nr:DNA alkylation response protein [Burkholderiaceae bacterium]